MKRRRSKISIYKQSRLLELFVGGVPARTGAELVGVNRHSATLYYQKIREMITREMADGSPFEGEVELDESWFGGKQSNKAHKPHANGPMEGKLLVVGAGPGARSGDRQRQEV